MYKTAHIVICSSCYDLMNDSRAREANSSKRALTSIGTSLGHNLAQKPFGTVSFHPLAGAVFLTVIQITLSLSSDHMLLIHIAYSISLASYKCLNEEDSIAFKMALLLHCSSK